MDLGNDCQLIKALYKFADEILCALDDEHTSRLFCDLDKACDSVNHDTLLSKPHCY
jgi:hypothetical protein